MQEYLKSLNPKPDEQAILVYGSEYKLWKNGEFIGTAFWTQDDNVGDSFQNKTMRDGKEINQVFIPDRWELVIKK